MHKYYLDLEEVVMVSCVSKRIFYLVYNKVMALRYSSYCFVRTVKFISLVKS